jgi:hypothetical protein
MAITGRNNVTPPKLSGSVGVTPASIAEVRTRRIVGSVDKYGHQVSLHLDGQVETRRAARHRPCYRTAGDHGLCEVRRPLGESTSRHTVTTSSTGGGTWSRRRCDICDAHDSTLPGPSGPSKVLPETTRRVAFRNRILERGSSARKHQCDEKRCGVPGGSGLRITC